MDTFEYGFGDILYSLDKLAKTDPEFFIERVDQIIRHVNELKLNAESRITDQTHKEGGSELEKDYSAKTGKPLITDSERTALGDLASLISKKPGDGQLEIF